MIAVQSGTQWNGVISATLLSLRGKTFLQKRKKSLLRKRKRSDEGDYLSAYLEVK